MSDTKIISTATAENSGDAYASTLHAAGHFAIADEPAIVGGKDTGPSPGEYLCMSLASCKAITLRMYVQRKKWNLENIKVKVSLEKLEAEGAVTHIFHAEIIVDETIPAEQKERLLYIAKACPISKLLSKQNEVVTKVL
jgi:putative redox protein